MVAWLEASGRSAFSEDDVRFAQGIQSPIYLITPQGRILKYDPATDEVTLMKP